MKEVIWWPCYPLGMGAYGVISAEVPRQPSGQPVGGLTTLAVPAFPEADAAAAQEAPASGRPRFMERRLKHRHHAISP
jgi:hypothetical protein